MLREYDEEDARFGVLMGTSRAMQSVYQQIEYIAARREPVFILGETGTGKELCGQAIYRHGGKGNGRFLALCCRALDESEKNSFSEIPEEPFTLFLDEVMELPSRPQSQLLSLIHTRNDIRYICSCSYDPLQALQAGRFRKELFYRLHVLSLQMPNLRDCGHDIIDLSHAFLCEYARAVGKGFNSLSADAESLLKRYPWPGNIRELQSVILQTVLRHNGEVLEASMLPEAIRQIQRRVNNKGSKEMEKPVIPLWLAEKKTIEQAIEYCEGNISKAARLLEISASTIYRKMESWQEKKQSSEQSKSFR